jgi:uncharacterized protein YbcI
MAQASSLSGVSRAEISDAVVALHRRYFGKGPARVKTYIEDNVCLCVLENVSTPLESSLASSGRESEARMARVELLHETAEHALRPKIEELTQHKVEAFVGGHHTDHDITTLTFLLSQNSDG